MWWMSRGGRAGWAATVGVAVGAALVLAACTGPTPTPTPTSTPTSTPTPTPPGPVTITWQYRTYGALEDEPLVALWSDVAAEFEAANPHVTVELAEVGYDDPPPDGDDLPDVFDVAYLRDTATLAAAGDLRDLTDELAPEIAAIGGPASAYRLDGRSYAVPWSFSPFGLWVNMDVLAGAGIEDVPATFADLLDAVGVLRAAGMTPIALDGLGPLMEDYWDFFVLVTCSTEVLEAAVMTLRFDDPCFVDAGARLAELLAADPFVENFIWRVPGGLDDAEGLVATGEAAMLVSGTWSPAMMRDKFEQTGHEASAFPELAWSPLPAGGDGAGDETVVVGIGNAFSVSADAPEEAIDLLRYILSVDVQSRLLVTGGGTPVVAGAQGSVDEELQPVLAAQRAAGRVSLYFGKVWGPPVSYAKRAAVNDLFAGNGTPQDVVDAMNAAAETL